jgi:AcrR family transcriptional regulator
MNYYSSMNTESIEQEVRKEARGQRRKRRTRERLLAAALDLVAERGIDAVAINEITEAADVGVGSFYNHFESKDALYRALVDELLGRYGAAVARIAETIDDPAEIIAASVRTMLLRARREPRWGRFLLRTSFMAPRLEEGLGEFLIHDLERGIGAGRFTVPDKLMAFIAVGGASTAAIASELEYGGNPEAARSAKRRYGFDWKNLPERTAATVLVILGLPRSEAEEISERPLPDVEGT